MTRVLRCLALACLMLPGAAADAMAHAFPDHAAPAVGSTVHAPPAQVRIWFTEALEPAFSTIAVTDAAGKPVAKGKARLDPGNPKLLEIDLPALPPGTYHVAWRVISVDTHPTPGDFSF